MDEACNDPTGCFEQEYCCFPLSHIDKSHLEDGNRIIMPASALDRLVSINIDYPMLFEIKNPSAGRVSHCGVLEFSAEEGFVFLPNWMMKNLQLQEGQLVNLKSTSLPKGTYMKIQPHSMKFTTLPDPKVVLETALRGYSCLSIGDTIRISHDSNQYHIDILETKPSNAISVVETDCEVEFAPPLDYKEPEKKPKTVITTKREPERVQEELKFRPFAGVARRFDGQASTESVSVFTSMVEGDGLLAAGGTSRAGDSNFRPRKRPGKLVFGPDEDASQPLRKSAKENSKDNQQKYFQPFTGKKHTLAG